MVDEFENPANTDIVLEKLDDFTKDIEFEKVEK